MKATDCKCIVCGKPAIAFWPYVDPDIPANPYCRKCLNRAKLELAVKLFSGDGKMLAIANETIKNNNKINNYGGDI